MSKKRIAKDVKLVALWLPREMVAELDVRVSEEDTDRSKWIRNAMRRQFSQLGIAIGKSPARSLTVAATLIALVFIGGALLHHGDQSPEPPALASGIE